MVPALCRRGGSITEVWQRPADLLKKSVQNPTFQSQKLSLSLSRLSHHQRSLQSQFPKGGVNCLQSVGVKTLSPGWDSTFLGVINTFDANGVSITRGFCLRGLVASNFADRPGNGGVKPPALYGEKQRGAMRVARGFYGYAPSSLGQSLGYELGYDRSKGSVVEATMEWQEELPSNRVGGVMSSAELREERSHLEEISAAVNLSQGDPASPPFQSRAESNFPQTSRLSATQQNVSLSNRILKGAIELKAVVAHSSPLAKTQDSKRALAEQRAKKRKEGSLELADGKVSSLEMVTTEDDVAKCLRKLERETFSELRIVNEDTFKEHMAFLKDPEEKQRISTYRTLAGRILSEHLTQPANQSLTPASQPRTPANQGPNPTVQCPDCWLPQENCMCREVHRLSRSLWPGMRIWMLMHSKEYRRKNNTGKVMWQLFGEDSVRLSVSGLDILENEMWEEFAAAGPGRVFLMYPERKAQEKMEIFYIDTVPLPSSFGQDFTNPSLDFEPKQEGFPRISDTPGANHAIDHSSEPPHSAAAADSSQPPLTASPETHRNPETLETSQSQLSPPPDTSPSSEPHRTLEASQDSRPIQTPERFQSPQSVQTPEPFQNPQSLETPESSGTPPTGGGAPARVHFVFLDGTWNNSTAMLERLQQQAERVWGRKMACLCLTPDAPSKMHSLRPQPALEKVCTAAAASMLLRELSGRPELSEQGLSDAADTVDQALEILVKCLQGWRARVGRSPTRGPNQTPAENWVPRDRSRSRSPVVDGRRGAEA